MTGPAYPDEPRLRCLVCGEEHPRSELGAHTAERHRPPLRDRPRRTVRMGGRGRGRR